MSEFRQVSDTFWASPQIALEDVARAGTQGFALIINNRPEGEAADQTPGLAIETAARAGGLDYLAIPVAPGGFNEQQVHVMAEALKSATGPVLAYCRSGTRSTLLWSMAEALRGGDPDALAAAAAGAGYDVGPIRHVIDMLAARARD